MKFTLKNITYLIVLLSLASCRKYVEIDLVGKRELKYTQDYQNLLNSTTNVERSYYFPVLASDDVYSGDEIYLNRFGVNDANAYTWKADIVGDNAEDDDWAGMYKQIYLFNQITSEIMQSQGGSEEQKRNILAQAKVHRALNYFFLVNIYAKQYNASTASSDLGVPLLTTPDLYASLVRKPVQQVYDQIIEDLSSAIPDLPIIADHKILVSSTAAEGILARVYLQMKNYAKALEYANSTLEKQSGLVDLKNYTTNPNIYPDILVDPEEIFIKSTRITSPTLSLHPDLIALFEEGDLRKTLFTIDGSAFGSWLSFTGVGYNKFRIISANSKITNGPNVPEMMLIKAEALARDAARYQEALAVLDKLREQRFTSANFTSLSLSSAQEILKTVIAERRKELMGKGLRWFDQKRLADEAGFVNTQTRTYKGETFTLAPTSNRYVLPIATKYIVLNPEIQQNPR
ncbi:RagB/SusD family nutrient uptake outer membrane protein [Sphingobacterium sp. LRF_L2]|uniref:RagB/SusD family nutrient uptake outer membrane protein n=1 Tax=Sphingobacterium sp. LRF_L2 TaxID=3369421 RepID=UPI003F5EDBB0